MTNKNLKQLLKKLKINFQNLLFFNSTIIGLSIICLLGLSVSVTEIF